MQQGRIPFDPAIARQCAAIAARLPATDTTSSIPTNNASSFSFKNGGNNTTNTNKMNSGSSGGGGGSSGEFSSQSAVETCDAMLSVLLAGVTMGTAHVANLADKHNLAFERMGGGGPGGGGGPISKRGGGVGKGGGGGGVPML